ncbi:MAG TPA: hypothetical protein VM573_01150 [Actinomycetota bacterium]|jgi:hypothetical protein|nr:hypothetical protein [Actinomycetota bacterium]
MDHVVVRKLEHLTGNGSRPHLGFAVETRDRPGPAHKNGAFPDDAVWVQLHGGLFVARARVELCWTGEYARIGEVRRRTHGAPIYDVLDFWRGRPKFGYAAVASLKAETWIEPFWAGPRTYGYEWILLDDDKKRASWLDHKPPPRGGSDLPEAFRAHFGTTP